MTKLVEMTVSEFLYELASSSPAPGGGSVAALSGALGAALSSMVCNLTLGKKDYGPVQEEIQSLLNTSEHLRQRLSGLVDRDTEAFNKVMDAYRLSKETDSQKEKRKQAIQHALKTAAQVPLETAKTCIELLAVIVDVAEKGNKSSISDAAVSAVMAHAGVESAILNIKINLGSIQDKEWVARISHEIETIQKNADEKTKKILKIVETTT